IDTALGAVLEAAQRAYGGRAVISVVSDHGFARMEQALQLRAAFRQAGLIDFDAKGKITGWKGMIWESGGLAAVVLKDPKDTATRKKVDDLLAKLAGEPANGIARVVSEEELHRKGGYPEAQWLVALKPGYVAGERTEGPLVTPASGGAHGYWPEFAEMNSS